MRKLSTRERVLLACLAVIATVSAYIMFFYLPITQHMDNLNLQIAQGEELQNQLDAKLAHKWKMQKTLEQLATQENAPSHMPEYDNLQAVMTELHGILTECQEYSISFQEEPGEDHILRRHVTMPFICANYEQAKHVLQKLHDSSLRSLLSDVQVVQQENGLVHGSVKMTFFEYQGKNQTEVTG